WKGHLPPGRPRAGPAGAAEPRPRGGAPAERAPAPLLLPPPTGDQHRVGTLRSAATAAAHRGAPRAAAAYLRRALAESPAQQDRGGILAELGWDEGATMQFEAGDGNPRAAPAPGAHPAHPAAPADLPRGGGRGRQRVCPDRGGVVLGGVRGRVRRPLGGGRGGGDVVVGRRAVARRSRALARAGR